MQEMENNEEFQEFEKMMEEEMAPEGFNEDDDVFNVDERKSSG